MATERGIVKEVEDLTQYLKKNGITVLSEPRLPGDGYYEHTICDPENNTIELITSILKSSNIAGVVE